MADQKKMTLEDLARTEAEALRRREQAKSDRVEGEKKIAVAMPERFFLLAKQVREAVNRFNTAARIERPVAYSESPAVTTRDVNVQGDFSLVVKRAPNEASLALRNMTRAGRADCFIIEGWGTVGIPGMNDRFELRIEAQYRNGEVSYRSTCLHKRLDTPIDELAERIVMVIVTGQLTRLWSTPPWLEVPQDNTTRR